MCIELEWPITALIAVVGVYVTWISARTTLKHRQFETAAAQLQGASESGGLNYLTRTAAIATLAKLARDHPKDYDELVMRVFEAFLSFPPCYGSNAAKEGQVDYTSRETVAIVDAIKRRTKRARDRYRLSLPPDRPFQVTPEGDVEPNPDYKEPAGMGIHRSAE